MLHPLHILLTAAFLAAAPTPPSTQPAPDLTLKLSNTVWMKLVLIPAGKFLMGSPADEKDRSDNESPQHEVRISKPFYMGVTPVTQGQWKAIMGKVQWDAKFSRANDDNPASQISWIDAMEFCRKLSARTGKTIKLPTEAQWEYACRAGSQTRFYYGDDPDCAELPDYGWYDKNTSNIGRSYPHAVAQKKPNAWGLYDMQGNVNQWCADWLGPYPARPVADPTGPASGALRVFRGGSFMINFKYLRAAARNRNTPVRRIIDNGCRVVAMP